MKRAPLVVRAVRLGAPHGFATNEYPRSYCATGRAIFAIGILLHCNMTGGGGDADLAFDIRKERS
jgi:hypothetical protein